MSHTALTDPRFEDGVCIGATDWLGQRFEVGDKVLYCIGAGRGQMMAIGVIKKMTAEVKQKLYTREVEPGEEPDYIADWLPQPRGFKRMSRPYWEIAVQVLTTKTSGYDMNQRTRPAWVNPMNITALPVEEVL